MTGKRYVGYVTKLRLFASAPTAWLQLYTGRMLTRVSDRFLDVGLWLIDRAKARIVRKAARRAARWKGGAE